AVRQVNVQAVHHLRGRDDENDKQHKHQIQQRRNVQFGHRRMPVFAGSLEAHGSKGPESSSVVSKRTITWRGKFGGGFSDNWVVFAMAFSTEPSHVGLPERLVMPEVD